MRSLTLMLCFLWMASANAADQADTETASTSHWLEAFKDQEELFSFEGYRIIRYRSPTPQGTDGAKTISTQTLQQMLHSDQPPKLLNVQPVRWQHGLFLQQEPFLQIPGSRWTPNVGMGELDEGWEKYFRYHLEVVTNHQQNAALVLYCRADCWMSWNAIKRAASWGYTNLYWYRDGVDGWRDAGLKMHAGTPEPYPVRNR